MKNLLSIFLLITLIPSLCLADSKISQYPQDTSPANGDVTVIVRLADGLNYKVALSDLKTYIQAGLITGVNWGSIGGIITAQNWSSPTPYLNRDSMNWPSLNNDIQNTGVNWPSLFQNIGNRAINWTDINIFSTGVGSNIGIGTSLPSAAFEVGNQKLDILSNGNIGIGTFLPATQFDMEGNVSGGLLFQMQNSGTATNSTDFFKMVVPGPQGMYFILPNFSNTGTFNGRNLSDMEYWQESLSVSSTNGGNSRDMGIISNDPVDFFFTNGSLSGNVEAFTIKGILANVGIKDPLPTFSLGLGGQSNRTIGMERNKTATTGGNSLTISSGGGTANGQISTINSIPTVAGSGYQFGDILNITGCGGMGGQVQIRNVAIPASSGIPNDFILINRGEGYSVSTGCATTPMFFSGTGATVNITAVTASSNVNGGNLILSSGISVGTGTSGMSLQVFPGNVGIGTFDNSPVTAVSIIGTGNVGIGTTVIKDGHLQLPANGSATGQAVCFGTNNCIGYCTAGTYPACSSCTCF